ncbi:MAG: hypothetical protein QF842_03790 [Candidatus Marinimicrobia bacterium]|jgi:hypothetical protein|nr:hypothetical protein [Candidatus Neomarinimicrobiota bacterium]MDP6611684.1 hypothetical protein [Candidatus Neomarinimicrobiota bacterium]|tara:strand:- start:10181 stop:10396 length:216 start_codon:yes stop_codon:yes gene_type:complete
MSGFLNDKVRLGIGIALVVLAIAIFIHGWFERSAGNPFSQIWMLAVISLLGAMIQLRKIGGGQKPDHEKDA